MQRKFIDTFCDVNDSGLIRRTEDFECKLCGSSFSRFPL